jgi:alpha-1,2-mannosyltransferase
MQSDRVAGAGDVTPSPAIPPGVRLIVRLALATVGFLWLIEGLTAIGRGLPLKHWDAIVDLRAARAFIEGYTPFSEAGVVRARLLELGPAGLGHPPTTAFWFLPLAGSPEVLSTAVLTFVVLLLLSLQVMQMVRLKQVPGSLLTAWLIVAYVVSCSFMRYHMNVGQISAVIGFWFFLAWAAARRGHDLEAGLALGAACTMKLFPGLVVVMFLLQRRWRVLLGAAAAYVGVAVIMTSQYGIASWPVFLSKQSRIADIWMGSIQNQSIHGVVAQLFAPICRPSGPVINRATYVSSVISLVLVGLASWLVWRSRAVRSAFDLQFWLFVVLSCVCSQWTWEHYTVIYVGPLLILACHLRDRWRSGRWRNWSTAVTAAGIMAIVCSWRVDHMTKEVVQARYFNGDTTVHVKLHLLHVLNFGPGFLLLALMMAAVWAQGARTAGPALPLRAEISPD